MSITKARQATTGSSSGRARALPTNLDTVPEIVDLTIRATFLPDAGGPYQGLYRGARCKLPGGEVVEVRSRRTPLYDLARELEARGYGDAKLQAYTHTGTPSLRGLVRVMAGLTVEESDKGGLRLRKYRPFSLGRSASDAQASLTSTGIGEKLDGVSASDRPTEEPT